MKDALTASAMTFVLCAVLYPGVAWALAQLAFPRQAEGSLIRNRNREVIGSELIAQPFKSPRYFWPRPSAVDYKADAAGGSNLGPHNPDLHAKVAAYAEAFGASAENPVPADLVTASGSGLDPHISVEAARYQAARVAASRRIAVSAVRQFIESHTETSGSILGASPRVNVLTINLALDEALPPG